MDTTHSIYCLCEESDGHPDDAGRYDKLLTVMDCAECKLLADQAAVAREELEKIRDRIVADFNIGSSSAVLMRALEAAERTHEKCVCAVQRHAQSHQQPFRGLLAIVESI